MSEQPHLREALEADPHAFSFVQLVRILERLAPERSVVGGTGDPTREVARFSVPPTQAFPASEVQSLELAAPGAQLPSRIAVNFLGLTGPLGVLPLPYTQIVADRLRARDGAMAEFLDLFHHRLLALYYRVWAKYRPLERMQPVEEKVDGGGDPYLAPARTSDDRISHHLLDLVGLGTTGLQHRLPIADEAAAYYAGLLAPVQRSALALEQLLEDHFGVTTEVEQFIGGWYRVDESTRCAIGEERDGATQLGHGAMAGGEIWDQQSRLRIRLGPLTRAQYERFLPTGSAYRPLEALVRLFTDDRFELELQLVLAKDQIPPCVLGDPQSLPLTWGSWLSSTRPPRDRDETVITLTPAASR
jgi:type VI secretion system protein ImpH